VEELIMADDVSARLGPRDDWDPVSDRRAHRAVRTAKCRREARLDEALEMIFPASDPIAVILDD
jgi:hypothetical protein